MAAQRRHWTRNGPPVHIGVAIIAGALGVKLTDDDHTDEVDLSDVKIAGPSIAELAAIAAGYGPDLQAASRAIAEATGI